MSEALNSTREPARPNLAAKIGWAVLIVATLYVCYFSHLGAIGFVGPDEPRYAWIARDMAETGDWVTPRLYGKPWFEKPPLFYWGAALSFKLLGVSEAAARLPSAVSALLATLALAWLAWRMYGAETARWLLLLLPTTVGMIGFSHAAATDMPFSAMLTTAMVCAAVALRLVPRKRGEASERNSAYASPVPRGLPTPWLALILFGFFLGAAALAKGPAGIVLCGGAVFFWALFTKRWRDAFRLLHPAAIAAFCATALPWYALCARRNPDFFRVFIIEHNFKRYLTPEFQHVQPFWFYGPILFLGLLPWINIVFSLLRECVGSLVGGHWLQSANLYFACCGLWPIVFFSFSKSKLPGYVLPSILFLGLLGARSATLRIRKGPGERWVAISTGVTLTLLGLFAFLQVEWVPFTWPALVLTVGGFAAIYLATSGGSSRAIIVGETALIVAIYLGPVGEAGRALDSSVSARYAFQTASLVWNDYSPENASTYKLQRAFSYSLNFYFHRELPEWSPNNPWAGWIFTSSSKVHELRGLGLDCVYPSRVSAVIVCGGPHSTRGSSGGGEPN